MDHIERFVRTIERRSIARRPGSASRCIRRSRLQFATASTFLELKKKVDDDVHVNVPYQSPTSNHVAAAFDFAKKDGLNHDYEERTLTAPGFFEDYEDPRGRQ